MKKHNHPAKLTLKIEILKALSGPDLKLAVGGATVAGHVCAHPTTTVLPTGDC
jgi:hypothetical protein